MPGPVNSRVQTIAGVNSSGVTKFVTNGNATDYLQVRLTDGSIFYTASGSSGGGATTINIGSFGGSAVILGNNSMAGSLPVTIASDQTAIAVNASQAGAWFTTSNVSNIVTVTGSNLTIAQMPTTNVSITGQPISTNATITGSNITISQLPTITNNLGSYGGVSTTLGQKSMAASMPVTIASDQSAVTIQGSNISIAQLPTGNVSITGQPISVNASQNGVWNIGTVTTVTNLQNATITSMPTTNVSVTGQPLTVNASQNGAWFTTSNVSNTVTVTGSALSIAQAPTTTVIQTIASNFKAQIDNSSWGGVSTTLGQKSMAASIPVTLASDQSAITFTGSNITISSMPTTNVSVTGQPLSVNASQSGSWFVTSNVSNTVTVTGSNISIAQLPTITNNVGSFGGTSVTIGQHSMAASLPVVIASDQSAITFTGSNISIAQLPTITNNMGSYGGTATTIGQKTMANSMPVVIASNQGNLGVTLNSVAPNFGIQVDVASIGGTAFSLGQSAAASSVSVVLASGTIPAVNAAITGQPILVRNNMTAVGGTAYALGNTSMAGSMPVNIASDQVAFSVNASQSGSWTTTNNLNSWGGTATTLGQKAMSASVPVTLASDQAPSRLATIQVLAATTFSNLVSTATSTPQLISGFKNIGLYYTISKAGAPTDVLIAPQFINNSLGTYADIGYGYLQDLRFSNAAIGTGIKEYVVHESIDNFVQYVVTATGLSSANTITTTLSIFAWN